MAEMESTQIGSILASLKDGEIDHRAATDRLFTLVYAELRGLASGLMHSERADHTLQTTALVHEVYLKLMRGESPDWQSRAHFFGVAARAMRQILVDHARSKNAAKHGGGWQRVTLGDDLGQLASLDEQIIELDSALTRFATQDGRMAQVAELRIFCGLKMNEVAQVLNISLRTAQGDWRVARMWLNRELAAGGAA